MKVILIAMSILFSLTAFADSAYQFCSDASQVHMISQIGGFTDIKIGEVVTVENMITHETTSTKVISKIDVANTSGNYFVINLSVKENSVMMICELSK